MLIDKYDLVLRRITNVISVCLRFRLFSSRSFRGLSYLPRMLYIFNNTAMFSFSPVGHCLFGAHLLHDSLSGLLGHVQQTIAIQVKILASSSVNSTIVTR